MGTPASIHNHPIHPMVVPFPIALWIFSLVCDLVYAMGWGGILWNDMGFYAMVGGWLGALVAAIPGYLDFRSISDPVVKRIGTWHMVINLLVVALFTLNLWLRMISEPGAGIPIVLSILGVSILGLSGWLGGELVYVHGVGVEPPPNSATKDNRLR